MSRSSRIVLVEPRPEEIRERVLLLEGRIRALELENKLLRASLADATKKLNAAAGSNQPVPPFTQPENVCAYSAPTEPEGLRGGPRAEHVG